mmetsp:Transcript_31093/g.52701  ORF Transcript_31093/g.52701 Transcript_31093/m.52701 type:complete len:82 (+) Transcript_31093:224-469(+)
MSFITLLAVATITGEDDSATAVTIGVVWSYDGITGVATTAVMTGAVTTVAAGVTGANVLETFVAWNELYRPDSPVLDLHAP